MNSVSFCLQIYQILSLPRQRPLHTLPGAIAPQIGWAGGVTTRGFGNQLQRTALRELVGQRLLSGAIPLKVGGMAEIFPYSQA